MPPGLVIWGSLSCMLLSMQGEVKISHCSLTLAPHTHSLPISLIHILLTKHHSDIKRSLKFGKSKRQAVPIPTFASFRGQTLQLTDGTFKGGKWGQDWGQGKPTPTSEAGFQEQTHIHKSPSQFPQAPPPW